MCTPYIKCLNSFYCYLLIVSIYSILLLNLTLPVTFPFFLSLFFSSYPFWIPSLPTTSLPCLPLSLPFSSLPFPPLLPFPSFHCLLLISLNFLFSLPFPSHAIPFHHPFTSLSFSSRSPFTFHHFPSLLFPSLPITSFLLPFFHIPSHLILSQLFTSTLLLSHPFTSFHLFVSFSSPPIFSQFLSSLPILSLPFTSLPSLHFPCFTVSSLCFISLYPFFPFHDVPALPHPSPSFLFTLTPLSFHLPCLAFSSLLISSLHFPPLHISSHL